jgi:glycosyltransferase involved in cell wall biosynthesis
MSGIAAVAGQQALVASSASEFASAIEHVLSNSSLAQKLARSARALVESQYAWAKIGPNYLRLLSQARQIGRRGS